MRPDEIEVKLGKDYDPDSGMTPIIIGGEAEGAIPVGTLVRKINTEPGDTFVEGTKGVVISSLHDKQLGYFYFVLFESDPPFPPVGVSARRIEVVES